MGTVDWWKGSGNDFPNFRHKTVVYPEKYVHLILLRYIKC